MPKTNKSTNHLEPNLEIEELNITKESNSDSKKSSEQKHKKSITDKDSVEKTDLKKIQKPTKKNIITEVENSKNITNFDDQLESDYNQTERPFQNTSEPKTSAKTQASKVEIKEAYLYNSKTENASKSNNLFLKTLFLIVSLALLGYLGLGLSNSKSTSNIQNQNIDNRIDKKTCANNNNKMDIPTNLKIEDTVVGSGKEVFVGCEIKIHYRGYVQPSQQDIDEKKEITDFDNSFKRGEPFSTQIGVGKLIKGWDIGIVGMKEGGKRKLTIPPELAYGSIEIPGIPANSTLVFEVELIQVLDQF